MSEILSREEFRRMDPNASSLYGQSENVTTLQERERAFARTIVALAEALVGVWTHADSHERSLAREWKPVIDTLRDKGWIE